MSDDDTSEDDIGVRTLEGGSNSIEREEMVKSYLPGEDDWEAKTILDVMDPSRVAVLRNVDRLWPHVDHHQPIINVWLDHFLRSRTSVAGQSREDAKDILVAAMGGNPSEQPGGAKIMQAFGIDEDD